MICNKCDIRDKLMNRFPSISPEQELTDNILEGTYTSTNSTSTNTTIKSPIAKTANTFTITIPKEEFQSMIMCKIYRRKDKDKKESVREYTVLRSGNMHLMKKIWVATKITCGFNFKNHKLLHNRERGYANGTCKCGALHHT